MMMMTMLIDLAVVLSVRVKQNKIKTIRMITMNDDIDDNELDAVIVRSVGAGAGACHC